MRKMMLFTLVVLFAAGLASAQVYSGNSVGGLQGMDVLGAHNNGGRGCAGCHAPHSGAAGGGGNAASGAKAFNDPLSGSNALFGQDVTPLYGISLTFGNGYVEALPSNAAAYTTNEDELRGIMFCLACHDGQIAKGQMMQGTSWEQARGLLPAGVYGPRGIPTLLGNDNNNGNTSAYGNDHPVGTQATLGALRLVTSNATTSPLTVTVTNGSISSIIPTPGTAYANFAANYGYPAIAGSPWSWGVSLPAGDSNAADAFITCTTCHNQHVMYIYQPPRGKQAGTAIVNNAGTNTSGTAANGYPTYFFVNAPYNPGTGNTNPTLAASTTQFCRQCHIGEANESFGVNNVATQF
jgi:nitrate/TMAO reductase-like tetraheme cytochrome c subunit